MEGNQDVFVWILFALMICFGIILLLTIYNIMTARSTPTLPEQPMFTTYSYTSDEGALSVLEHFHIVYDYLDEHPGIKYKERLMLRTHMDFIYDYIDILEESETSEFDKNEEM